MEEGEMVRGFKDGIGGETTTEGMLELEIECFTI